MYIQICAFSWKHERIMRNVLNPCSLLPIRFDCGLTIREKINFFPTLCLSDAATELFDPWLEWFLLLSLGR